MKKRESVTKRCYVQHWHVLIEFAATVRMREHTVRERWCVDGVFPPCSNCTAARRAPLLGAITRGICMRAIHNMIDVEWCAVIGLERVTMLNARESSRNYTL